MAEMTMEDLLAGLANRDNALAGAVAAYAMRPQKTSTITNTTSTNTPYALADMIANRNKIGQATRDLDEALKLRETTGYSLFNALASIPQQQGYGSWLSDFARALGGGAVNPMNAYLARAGTKHENAMKDLETILKYDKEMGATTNQHQSQTMKYDEMPWGALGKGKGSGNDNTVKQQKVYDFSVPEMPREKVGWGEMEIQATGRVDPETGVRTGGGILANIISENTNSVGLDAMSSNQTSYAKNFTTERIAEIANAAGGSRGIDTMPEVILKGGPELSANNMNSRRFEQAVQNRAWDIADQIIKANPNATITREELANAFINNFNHSIRKEHRVVHPLSTNQNGNNAKSEEPVAPVAQPQTKQYDYSKYGF